MNHFINQSNGSHRGHSLMGRAMLRRFALFFPMILLMLLFLPARMVAQKEASSSKYIATFDSDTETLTFEKYEGESLPSDSESEWVEDGTSVFEMFGSSLRDIKHIVINESFKTFTPTTLSSFFAALSELETITGLEYLNTANVTNMSFLFDHCQKLTSLDLSNFNTAKVTNMNKMFSNCSNLKTIYASDKFTTAAVTESKNMFSYCGSLSGDIDWSDKAVDKTYAKIDGGYFRDKAYDNRPWVKYADGTLTFRCGYKKILGENEYELNSDEELPAWNTHKNKITRVVFEASFANARPTTCYAWFKNFTFLNQIEGIENLNTENVTSMAYMFSSCNKLAELDVTHFNTANVKNMEYMFECCKGLSSLDVTNFNTANVTNMLAMFGRTSLTSLDVTHFNTANVKDMTSMFYACRGLTSLDVTNFNTANVTSMRDMFCNCDKLTSLDVTNFNTAKVTDMGYMFCRCHNLKEIYVSDKFVTDAVTNSYQMFAYCESLSGDIDWSDKAVDKTYAKTDGGYFRDKAYDNRPWVKYADGTLTFRWGYKKTLGENEYELNSDKYLPAWNTYNRKISKVVFEASFANARPTNCYAWFKSFRNLTQIAGIENLNTENVKDMSDMFYICSGLISLDVTHFNTENVKDMSNMFYGCSGLISLDVTHFNTENVTSMRNMFYSCSSLTSLDVTNFNTANVTDMSNMFSNCRNLTTIYVSDKFVINNKNYSLFFGCEKLKGAITEYDASKTDYTYANYTTGYFTKLVGKNGDEKIGAAGKTLATDNLVLDDDKDFVAYEPFAAKAASYNRTMNAGTTWATLCLPFEVSLANQNFRAFKLLSADDVTESVELEEIKTSIAAGTPVIIKMKDGATKLNFTVANKEIANEVKTAETANGNYQLQGLYTQKMFSKDTDNNCYIVKGDKLMNPAKLLGTSTEFVGSKPFRAYMVGNSSAPAAGARMFSISVGGSTTAIEQLETTADSKAEYYDLQGRRLQNLQKGVNIVKRGGKTMKVIIK
ncbi:BspA family leucine-rich repeat surface protein [Segatella copri]|uniref:BspA family leucine-rich repeat surface protein n=1 Tax=Segatella copri TaxID=165179 RepID=UPI003F728813